MNSTAQSTVLEGFEPRPRRALVVRGGWDGHAPVEATDLFIPFLQQQGFTVDVHEGPEVYADADTMAATDLVMQTVTMSTASLEQVEGLRRAVANGTGLAGWHGGIADSYRDSAEYLQLVGGQFVAHPMTDDPEHPFTPHRYTFLPAAADHPITRGLDDFELTTEQYWVLADPLNDVLATTTQAVRPGDPWHREITNPAVWTRQWGEGRIAVITPGHSVDVLQHPTVHTLVQRCLLWASR